MRLTTEQQATATKYMRVAQRFATAYVRSVPHDDVEDLFQLAYLGLCKAAQQYDGELDNAASFEAYLWFKVRGEVADHYRTEWRAKKRNVGRMLFDSTAIAETIDYRFSDDANEIDELDQFTWYLRDLSPLQQKLLCAKYLEQRVQNAMTIEFGMKKSTISKYIVAAYDQLRPTLDPRTCTTRPTT